MSIEGLGRKFQEARKARNLSLEEAARLTRIRQSRLAEIEADDFSNFPSLAYAKGFLQIYGKFLEVDVSPYLDFFETSGHLTVDGYSYLQDAPAPKAPRTAVTRRGENSRPSLVPFLIGIAILVAGFWFLRFISNLQRITPRPPEAAATATPSPTEAVATIVAPRALPVESPARVAATAPPVNRDCGRNTRPASSASR
jgi:cytoskeleton protein RodZ